MITLAAAGPILLCVILMTVFSWPAKRAMPLSWLFAAILAAAVWKMDLLKISSETVLGFLSASEILMIIFGAILLMNVLRMSGAMAAINNVFSHITMDARIQCVLVGFVFAGFIEGTAGCKLIGPKGEIERKYENGRCKYDTGGLSSSR